MIKNDLSDEELMMMYQKGSEDAFQVLYRRHSSKIFGYVRSKIKNEEKARDIFQEVFMKIHRSKNLYNQSFPVLPWIFTITRNVILDEFRKSSNLVLVPEIDIPEAAAEIQPDLSPAIGQLPDNQKSAVQMRYFDEKTFQEIATHLNSSEENIRQLVSRGIKKLRAIIGSGENHE